MAGGALKYRHLGRKSSHRQALLRNLVTSLIEHESISTTWPKAKEAQRLADKLITLGKKNTENSRRAAQAIFFSPFQHLPKLFTTLRERYLNRPGGYTRVLRIEPLNRHNDQAPSAILELVDGPKDMRFAMTARTIVRERALADEQQPPSSRDASSSSGGRRLLLRAPPREAATAAAHGGIRDYTAANIRKVTRFRPEGIEALEREVTRLELRAKQLQKQQDQERANEKKNLLEKERQVRTRREEG